MNRRDDKELAAEDIVNRPEVAQGEREAAQKRVIEIGRDGPAASPEPTAQDEKAAKLLTEEFTRAYAKLTGEEIPEHRAAGMEELAQHLFTGLRRLPYAGLLRGGIIALCIIAPCVPALWKLFKPTQLEGKNEL